jgi:uncharacterized protein with HEPN domain
VKDDRVYLKHILRCITRIEEYTAGGREGFFASHLIQDGVIRNLQTLAESSQHLSEGVKALQSSVDWKGLAGFGTSLCTTTWASTSSSCTERSNRMSRS